MISGSNWLWNVWNVENVVYWCEDHSKKYEPTKFVNFISAGESELILFLVRSVSTTTAPKESILALVGHHNHDCLLGPPMVGCSCCIMEYRHLHAINLISFSSKKEEEMILQVIRNQG